MLDHTGAIPGCDIDLHAKKKLSLWCSQSFLLVFLLAEKDKTISLFRGSVDLHGRDLSVFLKFVEQSIFQTRVYSRNITSLSKKMILDQVWYLQIRQHFCNHEKALCALIGGAAWDWPVERTGRFWTFMPKLLRGSSLSRDDRGRAEGAGTAADCTERAGESSLELLLESLWQNSNRDWDAVVDLALAPTNSHALDVRRCDAALVAKCVKCTFLTISHSVNIFYRA